MDRIAVSSSNLASAGYDSESRILEIKFHNGGVYRYTGVPPEEYKGLMGASSHGKYFAANIRGKYAYKKVA